jgi:hypothetical protein
VRRWRGDDPELGVPSAVHVRVDPKDGLHASEEDLDFAKAALSR